MLLEDLAVELVVLVAFGFCVLLVLVREDLDATTFVEVLLEIGFKAINSDEKTNPDNFYFFCC